MFGFMHGNKYIGVDTASGGYPYESDHMGSMRMFHNIESAEDYRNIFKNEFFTKSEEWVLKRVVLEDIGR